MTVYELRFLIVYGLVPIAVLLLFFLRKPKYALWAVPICAALFLLVYWREFLYYESRPLGLLFLAVQAAVVAILALVIRTAAGKRR